MISVRDIRRIVKDETKKLFRMVRRGVITAASGDYFIQAEQLTDELISDVELWQQFGLASRPPAGSEVLTVHPYGSAEGAVAVAVNSRDHRPTLAQGDAALYAELTGGSDQALVKCRQDGQTQVHCATGKFVEVGGDAEKLLLGESFEAKLSALNATLTPLVPAVDPATTMALVNALLAALKTFAAGSAALLATKGKVT